MTLISQIRAVIREQIDSGLPADIARMLIDDAIDREGMHGIELQSITKEAA